MKKAVLIAIGNDYPRWERAMIVAPPLGVLSVGSYLAAHNVPVELIDAQMDFGFGLTAKVEQIVAQRIARYLKNQADTIAWVGISQHSNTNSGLVVAQEISAALPEMPLILGGYFPSTNHRQVLETSPFVTAIVRGDGEVAALEISRRLARGQTFLSEHTPNLSWRNGSEIHSNPIQPLALDTIPIFDFSLLRNKSAYHMLSMPTSRGCPFECNYCLESGMRTYAPHPTDWIARQLVHIKAVLPNNWIYMADPMFGIGRERTLEICRLMKDHDFIWGFQSRVDVLTPDLLPALSRGGAELVYWGMESASPDTLIRMKKVRSVAAAETYIKDALAVLKACFENNVAPVLGLMLAFPGDTEADNQASLAFVKTARRLRDQVAADTGVDTPFMPFGWQTRIYAGSALAECLADDFPPVVLRTELAEDETTVLSPSPAVPPAMIEHYRKEIEKYADYDTPRVIELMNRYVSSDTKNFAESHKDLIDSEGVIRLHPNLQPAPQ